jgi:murein L,D-transpeptidase YafK
MYIKVDKSKKRLQLIDNESVVFDFPCATGKNKGKKEIEKDLKTPEGEYKVVVKNPKSKCFLSLGLNYPNVQDAEDGFEKGAISKEVKDQIISANQEDGIIPWDTKMGGEIYIHGNLDNGKDYTLGCVKVSDENMKKLYDAVEIGIRVVIE